MVSSLPLLSCESSVSVKKILIEKKNKKKHALKTLQQLLQDFIVYLIILWTLGFIRLIITLSIVDLNVHEFKTSHHFVSSDTKTSG